MHAWLQELPEIDRGDGLFSDGAPEHTMVQTEKLAIDVTTLHETPGQALGMGAIGGFIAAGVVILLLLGATVFAIVRGRAQRRKEAAKQEKTSVCLVASVVSVVTLMCRVLNAWCVCKLCRLLLLNTRKKFVCVHLTY